MKLETVAIESLTLDPNNARLKKDYDALKKDFYVGKT